MPYPVVPQILVSKNLTGIETFTEALALVTDRVIPPNDETRVVIACLSAETFEENIEIPDGVVVFAPAARLKGTITLRGRCDVTFDVIENTGLEPAPVGGDQGICVQKLTNPGADGLSVIKFRKLRSKGLAGVGNLSSTGIVILEGEQLDVDPIENFDFGIGVGSDTATGSHHIHVRLSDIYLRRAQTIAIGGFNPGAYVVGNIDHVVSFAADTIGIFCTHGKISMNINEILASACIFMQDAGAAEQLVNLICGRLIASNHGVFIPDDYAYLVDAGQLNLVACQVVGTVSVGGGATVKTAIPV